MSPILICLAHNISKNHSWTHHSYVRMVLSHGHGTLLIPQRFKDKVTKTENRLVWLWAALTGPQTPRNPLFRLQPCCLKFEPCASLIYPPRIPATREINQDGNHSVEKFEWETLSMAKERVLRRCALGRHKPAQGKLQNVTISKTTMLTLKRSGCQYHFPR